MRERREGEKGSADGGVGLNVEFDDGETASRCHDWRIGKAPFFAGMSNTQYARFRMPISILRMRVDFLEAAGVLTISSRSLWMRMGFVPLVCRPHLKARSLSCVSLSVDGGCR